MEENQYINKNRPVYISFVAEDKEKVEALYNNLTAKHIKVEWMYHNLPGNEIVDFERKIGFGEFVIMVFGKKYFESWDCMYEFTLVSKYSKLNSKKKIFCVRFDEHDDFKNGNYLDSITKFWQDRKTEGTMFYDRRDLAKYYDYYLNSIPLLRHKYNDFVYLKDNYDSVVKAVQNFFAQNPTPITNSSEIFYKFDKDMWKNLVLKGKINGDDQYFIPDIREGLDAEDQVLFDEMINELQSGDNPVLYKVYKPDSDERTSSYPNPLILKSKKYSFTLTPRPHEHFSFTYYLVQRDFVDEFEATNELDNYHDAYFNVFTKIYGRQAKIEG